MDLLNRNKVKEKLILKEKNIINLLLMRSYCSNINMLTEFKEKFYKDKEFL